MSVSLFGIYLPVKGIKMYHEICRTVYTLHYTCEYNRKQETWGILGVCYRSKKYFNMKGSVTKKFPLPSDSSAAETCLFLDNRCYLKNADV